MGKKNIRCNAVAPGLVLTPAALDNLNEDVRNIFLGQCATPYLGEPEDVAATIAFWLRTMPDTSLDKRLWWMAD